MIKDKDEIAAADDNTNDSPKIKTFNSALFY
jgi:hypothetical protein